MEDNEEGTWVELAFENQESRTLIGNLSRSGVSWRVASVELEFWQHSVTGGRHGSVQRPAYCDFHRPESCTPDPQIIILLQLFSFVP